MLQPLDYHLLKGRIDGRSNETNKLYHHGPSYYYHEESARRLLQQKGAEPRLLYYLYVRFLGLASSCTL